MNSSANITNSLQQATDDTKPFEYPVIWQLVIAESINEYKKDTPIPFEGYQKITFSGSHRKFMQGTVKVPVRDRVPDAKIVNAQGVPLEGVVSQRAYKKNKKGIPAKAGEIYAKDYRANNKCPYTINFDGPSAEEVVRKSFQFMTPRALSEQLKIAKQNFESAQQSVNLNLTPEIAEVQLENYKKAEESGFKKGQGRKKKDSQASPPIEPVQERAVAQTQSRKRSASEIEIEWINAIRLRVNKQHAMQLPNQTSKVSGVNSNPLFQPMVAESSLPLASEGINNAADSVPPPNTPSKTS